MGYCKFGQQWSDCMHASRESRRACGRCRLIHSQPNRYLTFHSRQDFKLDTRVVDGEQWLQDGAE